MLEANLSFKEILPQNNSNQEEPFRKGRREGEQRVGRKAKQKLMGWVDAPSIQNTEVAKCYNNKDNNRMNSGLRQAGITKFDL